MEEFVSQQNYKKLLRSTVASVALVGALASLSVTSAEAGGFALREQSAIGQGSSFAGIAAGGGLSAMFWNPATLTQVQGTNFESVFSYVSPDTDVDNLTVTGANAPLTAAYNALSDPGSVGLSAIVPASYSGSQITEDLFVGLSINAPYGLATKVGPSSKTSFHSSSAKIFTADIKANIAYRINDMFSVGAGLGVTYGKVKMKSNPGLQNLTLEGDDWAPVFSLGATFTPFDGTTIGIGYRSETLLKLKGTETFNGAPADISARLQLPSSVTVGLRQDVTERFTFLAGFEWTDWSTVEAPVPIVGSPLNTSLQLGYKDGWYASVGGEYKYNDELTLRTGIGWEKSPIPTAHRNLRLPDADRLWASIGASYQINEQFGVDLGYSHLFVKDDVAVSGSNSTGNYTATANSSVDIISASMRYQWKPEPLFANDEPIVRKY